VSDPLSDAVLAQVQPEELAHCPVPDSFLATCLHREDEDLFAADEECDVRRTIHLDEVPVPRLAPDEVLVAVMASAVNYNTVWSATFKPMSTFRFLDRYGKTGDEGARHALNYHILGSDGAGVIVRTGSLVRHWKVGDKVVISPLHTDDQDPMAQRDGMLPEEQRAWGFETNFGGLAHYTIVRATQILPKPAHLSWEEAACNTLCLMTAYRMLISDRGASMRLGDLVLVWGATGGLGVYATQLAHAAGGRVVGVVSSKAKADLALQNGCDFVLDRSDFGPLDGDDSRAFATWREMGAAIRREFGNDPNIVFEHVGRQTFGASVFLASRGGTVVTCGSSTGYRHEFDNRFLWMRLKRIIGSHGGNYHEAWEANRLLERGVVNPGLSKVYPLREVGEAVREMQLNAHVGKIGVLCLATSRGQGIDDPELRERIGEKRLTRFEHSTNAAR
jgi:crotonyl-CoA reductase